MRKLTLPRYHFLARENGQIYKKNPYAAGGKLPLAHSTVFQAEKWYLIGRPAKILIRMRAKIPGNGIAGYRGEF